MIINDNNEKLTLIIPTDSNFCISEKLNIKEFTMYMKFDDFVDMKNTIENYHYKLKEENETLKKELENINRRAIILYKMRKKVNSLKKKLLKEFVKMETIPEYCYQTKNIKIPRIKKTQKMKEIEDIIKKLNIDI